MDIKRSSGVLLHITSLPGNYGIGTLGDEAFKFARQLQKAGQSFWQVLPLGPVSPVFEYSPYASKSTFAGNPLLISLDQLKKKWFELDIKPFDFKEDDFVNFDEVVKHKMPLLKDAADLFFKTAKDDDMKAYELFCEESKYWLDDYVLFSALADHFKTDYWLNWEKPIAMCRPEAMKEWRVKLKSDIDFYMFAQYLFFIQWSELKEHCNSLGIKLIGDIPIYITFEGADAWAHSEIFQLDKKTGKPKSVSGVPPDYFSETGQRWGNPLYNWEDDNHKLNKATMKWWVSRLQHLNRVVDLVRIDHFRALESFWSIPAKEPTAVKGKWVKGPGISFFKSLKKKLGDLPLIAEDLGEITPEVEKLRDDVNLPGMKVLQFAFDFSNDNYYLPHNYTNRNIIVYTGTHDNNTTNGWFYGSEIDDDLRKYILEYIDSTNFSDFHWQFIKLAYASVANLVIIPAQDVLGYGEEFRMNRPGTVEGNWKWKLKHNSFTDDLMLKLKHAAEMYGRENIKDTQST
jgi:4-alpha-glucanotransferase